MISTVWMRFPLDWSPEIEVLHDCLDHGEIGRLTLLVRMSDLDWQYQALESLSSLTTKTSRLRSWYEASPGALAPSIALALHLVRKAYDRRGDGPKGEAEAAQWAAEAREIVDRAAASEPGDPRITCARIEVARVEGGRDTIRKVWDEASVTHPDFFPLLVAVMTCVSLRFFGTEAEILAFARSRAAEAGPGEVRGVLPVLAHAEIAASRIASLSRVDSFRSVTDPYFGQDSVRGEILQCVRTYLGPDVSAWDRLDVRALNFLLFTLELCGEPTPLLAQAIGGRYTEIPWGWLGDSRETFERFVRGNSKEDKWAQEVWLGDMNAVALIFIGLMILYFTLPEALLSAKADRSLVVEGGFFGGPVLVHTPWIDISVGVVFSALLLLFGAWLLMVKVTRDIARDR